MKKFTITDRTAGSTSTSNGTPTPNNGVTLSEVDLQESNHSFWITTARTSDVCVLTGGGNDVIDTSRATGNVFIDAGSGINFIQTGKSTTIISAEESSAMTWDTIKGFGKGDCFTLNGQFALNWQNIPGLGTVLSATEAGFAPITAVFLGVSRSSLTMTIGHGGSQDNILFKA